MFIQYRYPYQISLLLSHDVILLYPSISFYPYMVRSFVWALSAVRGLFFGSNALPISFNILSYPLTQQRGNNCILPVSNLVSFAY